VPLEEYVFFFLQTLLTGLWTVALLRRFGRDGAEIQHSPRSCQISSLAVGLLWVGSIYLLLAGEEYWTYLALILSWALAPIIIQFLFGFDILRANWRTLLLAVAPTTVYLWIVDAIALSGGTWVIDPSQTTGWKLGVIPVEEMVFFFMTNLLIALGVTLMLSSVSQERAEILVKRLRRRRKPIVLNSEFKQKAPLGFRLWMAQVGVWVLALIMTPISLWLAGEDTFALVASIGVITQLAASLTALSFKWRARRISLAVIVTFTLTWLVEYIGVQTGWPFGSYTYSAQLQPQIGGVPLLIPLAWMMMLPPSWAVAEMIVGSRKESLGSAYWWIFSALAGVVFTAWDLYLDPLMVKRGLWNWQEPGAYFGIPLANFVGWWLTAATITRILRPGELPQAPLFSIYSITWIFQAIGLGFFWGLPGPALFGFLGMGFFVAAAWRVEGRKWLSQPGAWWVFWPAQSRSR
jgi:putative membrane protein